MSTLGAALGEPVFLAALFVGCMIILAAFIVAWTWSRSKNKSGGGMTELIQTLMSIRAALEFNREEVLGQERERISRIIDDAVHNMGEGFGRELDNLGRAAGLIRVGEGRWGRLEPEPLVFRPNMNITDATVGSVHLVTERGFAAALRDRDYAPLPFTIGSNDPYEIAMVTDDTMRSALWRIELEYIAECGYEGESPWQPHPVLQRCTWHEVIRADLIDQCGWAMLLDIEKQYPPVKTHPPYVDWKAAQPQI